MNNEIAVIENSKDQERLEDIKYNIDQHFSFWGDNLDSARESKIFLYGDQWDDMVKSDYAALGKVMLTVNKLAANQRRMSAEVRAATPALEVNPTGERTEQNENNANIWEAYLRKVFLSSDAKRAFQIAFDNSTIGGFGVIEVLNEYKDTVSFDQEIKIVSGDEPERYGFDPAATEPTKSDGDYCFKYNTISKKKFEKIYGFEPPTTEDILYENNHFAWADTNNVTVIDYYEKEYFNVELYKLKNGKTIKAKKYKKMLDYLEENPQFKHPDLMEQLEIVQKRKAQEYDIYNYEIIANKILKREKWAGKELRFIYVDGNSYRLEGDQHIQAFIKDAIDSQKFENYIKSETVQNIKDSTKEDYIGTEANIAGNENQWKDKRRRKGILIAKPDPITKQMPLKQPPSQINPQLLGLGTIAEEDIKATLGIFDSSQGANGTDLSGKAENIRINQGNLSNFTWIDNLNRAIEQTGKCVISLFANLNKEQHVMIPGIGEDGSFTSNEINIPNLAGKLLNNITEGSYEVSVSASSAFAAQRDAEYQKLLNYAQAFPVMQNAVQDLAAKKLTSDISADVGKRAQLTLPPIIKATLKDNPELAKQGQQELQKQQQMQQQSVQLQQMAATQQIQDNKIVAISDQITALAKMMDAQTNREEAQTKGVIEAARLQAEEDKAAREEQTAIIKTLKEVR